MADGYTHDPDALDDEAVPESDSDASTGSTPGVSRSTDPVDGPGTHPDGPRSSDAGGGPTDTPGMADREFDWRGWVLVGAIAVCFLLIPGVIFLYPYVGSQVGLTFSATYLALPMVPAIVLAVLAVWATTRP